MTGRFGMPLDVTMDVRKYTGRMQATPKMEPAGIRLPMGKSGQYRPRDSTDPVYHTTANPSLHKPLFQNTTGNTFGMDTPLNRCGARGSRSKSF